LFHPPQLDPDAGPPLYRQLHDQIKDDIHSGSLVEGDRLPATRELAASIGVNRTTVTAAYRLLEAEGLIRRFVGRGSFVSGDGAAKQRGLAWKDVLGSGSRPAHPPLPRPPADAILFSTSQPSDDLFPLERMRAIIEEVTEAADAREILQLGSPLGYEPLRRYLTAVARSDGIARRGDDVIVTSGCQQALDLLGRILIEPGDTVIVEDPIYPGVSHVLERAGARLVGVPVGREGVELDRMERALRESQPRLVVLTPDFQNPTGVTLPTGVRKALIRMIGAAGAVLVEIDIYSDLRYHGKPLPTLKQLDRTGDVVQLRSFSKIAFPGLRVGWVIAPAPLIARLADAKQWSDLHTAQLSQAVLLRFAESGELAQHRGRVRAAGSKRLTAILDACERHLPEGSRFTRPDGGMSLWVKLPEPLDAGELLSRAHRENVSYLPGKYFGVSQPHTGCLRLSFGGLAPDRIEAGLAILGGIFKTEAVQAQQTARLEPAPAIV